MAKKNLGKEELERLEKIVLSLDEHFDFREYGFGQAYEQCKERPQELERDWEAFCARDTDIIVKTKIGKKWAAKNKLNFDYDASDLACYIYWKLYFLKEPCIIVPERGEYRLEVRGAEYRGDVMNSWSTTLGRCDSAQMRQAYIQEFMKIVYTIGNFIPCPAGCNRPGKSLTQDYWDLTLWYLYLWYHGAETQKETALEKLFWKDQYAERHIEAYGEWLAKFDTWDDFVEKNYLQDYTEWSRRPYGRPKELWEGHLEGPVLPKTTEQVKAFFTRATQCIEARSKRMVAVLKGDW